MGHEGFLSESPWPKFDEAYITTENTEYPVQINGKIRFKIIVPASSKQEEVLILVRSHEKFAQFVGSGNVQKEIFIPGKLVSLVVTS